MRHTARYCINLAAAGLLSLGLQTGAFAGSITYIGTWEASPGAGNPVGVGGPGLATGQRYVVKVAYDDASIRTDNVDVLTGGFAPSGKLMSTIDLTGGTNTLDIFVPMEGLDAGTPFIYTQNEGNHFGSFIPNPTLNFANGSDISNTGNIIGMEFEGDFAGAANNYIEIFNTAPPGPIPNPDPTNGINLVSQINNFGTNVAMVSTNNLLNQAVAVTVDAGGPVVYNASTLTATAFSSHTDNDLGNARSDGEDFNDSTWTESGGALTGAPAGADGHGITVAIENSGLTSTVSTANWDLLLEEQMTDLSATDAAIVSYANTDPTLSASATVMATGIDFDLLFDDVDLVVNSLIANFESLVESVLLDGTTDVTGFFSPLFSAGPGNPGTQFENYAALEAAFGGLGLHTLLFTVTDLANAFAEVTLVVDILDSGQPPGVPVPATLLLFLVGLLGMAASRGSRCRA